MSTDWMDDAEYEEHIRTGALGLRPPTYEELVDRADIERKWLKENRSLSEPDAREGRPADSQPGPSVSGSESDPKENK